MGEAVKWIAGATLVVVGLLWLNNHSWLCDTQCRETQQEYRADRLVRPTLPGTRGIVAGAPCIGKTTNKPGVWKRAPDGRLGCWVG